MYYFDILYFLFFFYLTRTVCRIYYAWRLRKHETRSYIDARFITKKFNKKFVSYYFNTYYRYVYIYVIYIIYIYIIWYIYINISGHKWSTTQRVLKSHTRAHCVHDCIYIYIYIYIYKPCHKLYYCNVLRSISTKVISQFPHTLHFLKRLSKKMRSL